MKKFIKSLTLLTMSLILAIGMAGCTSFIRQPSTDGSDNGTVIAKSVVFNASSSNEEVGELSLKEAYAAVARTAVAIRVKTSSETSAGSGVIVDMSYEENAEANAVYIITCHHVISSKGDVTVYLPDENVSYENDDYTFTGTIGEESGAITLIGGDQSSDIAVLKLNLDKTATSGNKLSADKIVKAKVPSAGYKLSVMDQVFALGNPTGKLPGTASVGYISYLTREVNVDGVGEMQLLQIDVATNHGNSGGGLYNLYGELIGITNAGNTDYEQINFAIPYKSAEGEEDCGFVKSASELLGTYTGDNYGYISGNKEKFGFTAVQSTDNEGKSYVYIGEITTDSQADKAGFKVKDVIISLKTEALGEKEVSTVAEVTEVLQSLNIGDSVTITVLRWNGYRQTTKTVALVAKQFRFCNTGK